MDSNREAIEDLVNEVLGLLDKDGLRLKYESRIVAIELKYKEKVSPCAKTKEIMDKFDKLIKDMEGNRPTTKDNLVEAIENTEQASG